MCFACRLAHMADCRQAEDADPAGGRRAGQGDRDHLRCGRQVGPWRGCGGQLARAQHCMHWLAAEAALSSTCVHSVCGPEAMRAQLWMRSAKAQRMVGPARNSAVALPPCSPMPSGGPRVWTSGGQHGKLHAMRRKVHGTVLTRYCLACFRSAAAPVAMMAAPAGGAAAAAPAVEEKTTFDVVLEEIPADKKVRRPSAHCACQR